MTVPGVDEISAGAIIEEREGRNAGGTTLGRSTAGGASTTKSASKTASKSALSGEEEDYSFKSVSDFTSRIPGLDASVAQYVSVNSATFRLVIEGQAAGVTHAIQAIAEVEGQKVRYLQWREDP